MATLPDYDGLLLAFNNKFLTNLIREKYILTQIRFKFISLNQKPMYRTFATYLDFYTYFQSILTNKDAHCLVGKVAVIESIKCNNEKLKIPNIYNVRNITTTPNVQVDFKLDEYRKKFNKSQVELYKKYLNRRFLNYMKDIATLSKFRKEQYIESCYIDPDYFDGDIVQLITV